MAKLRARYVDALLELAQESGELEKNLEQALLVRDVLSDAEILAFLTHPHITDSVKQELIKTGMQEHISKNMLGFLYLMIHKRRESLILPVLEDYITDLKRHLGVIQAKVVSAKSLTKHQLESIQSTLSQQIGMQVEIENAVNPNLLGGFYVEADGRIFDGTLKSKLNNVKNLLKREEHDAS